jgi:S-adenosylmethionine synthetase
MDNMNLDFELFQSNQQPVWQRPIEYVERKGLGHPDSICDSVMEAAAKALRDEYQKTFGRVLHHNLDKALLVAGQSQPRLAGGRIVRPMQIIAGDRAVSQCQDKTIPVDEIVEAAVLSWMDENLRLVDPRQHVKFRSEIQPGSAELVGIFDRPLPVANDTSAAVGFAPLSETEQVVLGVEHYINSPSFKQRFPVAGEDVKVMAVRRNRRLQLTIAIAMVDRYVASIEDYFEQKAALRAELIHHVRNTLQTVDDVDLAINTLDDRERGESGLYLTVIGTSAESGDGGEVGRGNAVNGLISLGRPTSNEAAAGKNSVCHVGNIYNHLSFKIAAAVIEEIPVVQEAYVWLCSQIGRAIDDPWSVAVDCTLTPGVTLADVRADIEAVLHRHILRTAHAFTD